MSIEFSLPHCLHTLMETCRILSLVIRSEDFGRDSAGGNHKQTMAALLRFPLTFVILVAVWSNLEYLYFGHEKQISEQLQVTFMIKVTASRNDQCEVQIIEFCFVEA